MSQRYRLPTPPPPPPAADAFILISLDSLPLGPEEAARLRALYEWAFNEAVAVASPSILDRDLLGVWN